MSKLAETKFRDEKLETAVVAYLIKKDATLSIGVEPEWFSSIAHQNMIAIVKDLQTPLMKSTLIRELKNRKMVKKGEAEVYKQVLEEVYKVPVSNVSKKNAQVNINLVLQAYEWRSILEGFEIITAGVKKDTIDLDGTKRLLKELGTGVRLRDAVESGDYVRGFEHRLEVMQKKKKQYESGEAVGIPTGIRIFDHIMGGLMKGEFGVIAGQPGVGKSAMLSAFALHAYRKGRNVLFITGEMSKDDVEFRMDADVSGVPASRFRLGNITVEEITQWKKALQKEHNIRDSFLEVVSFPKDFTTGDIEGHIEQIWDSKGYMVDLVCLDYINLMSPVSNRKYEGIKDWKAQADAVWDVKAMCAALKIGLWTANQVRDEGHDVDVLSLEHLKYSRAISETAPVVVGLVRNHDEAMEHVLELQVMKMRNAPLPKKSIVLKPNMEYMRIHEEVLPRTKHFKLIDPGMVAKKTPKKTQRRK